MKAARHEDLCEERYRVARKQGIGWTRDAARELVKAFGDVSCARCGVETLDFVQFPNAKSYKADLEIALRGGKEAAPLFVCGECAVTVREERASGV